MRKKGLWLSIVTVVGLMLFSTTASVTADAMNASDANTSNTIYDISEWQKSLTDAQVQKLKNEVPFVVLRVQYGSAYADKTFQHNRDLMDKYGVPYGVYSYSQYENPDDASNEAKLLYDRAPRARFYVNDYEEQTVTSGGTNKSTTAWVNALRPYVGQRKILFYSYASFMLDHAANAVSDYDGYWIAAYQNNEPVREHVLWQFTDSFYSNALGKNVDANMLNSKDVNWFIGDTNDANNPAAGPNISAPSGNQSANQVDNNQRNDQKNASSEANKKAADTNSKKTTKKKKAKKTTKKKKVVVNVNYTQISQSMTIAGGTGLKIYNHVPGDNRYKAKSVHNSSTYSANKVNINSLARNTTNGRTYYRVYNGGRLLGWINSKGLLPNVTYSKYHATKVVRIHPKVNFYNHVTNSGYANVHVTHAGTGYAYTPVEIKQRAKKDGWNSYYYKAYYKGKFIGWAYSSMFR